MKINFVMIYSGGPTPPGPPFIFNSYDYQLSDYSVFL